MKALTDLPVGVRLTIVIVVALLGTILLTALSLVQFHAVEDKAQALASRVNTVRLAQRITVRALDARSHLALALQHDPERPDIVQLHSHQVDAHLEAVARDLSDIRDAMEALHTPDSGLSAEEAAALAGLEPEVARFESQGVGPMRERIEAGAFHDANVILLKLTNPAYEAVKSQASTLIDRIAARTDAGRAEMDAEVKRTTMLVIFGGVALGVLCLIVGLRVTRSVTRQIGGEPKEAVRLMQQVAEGDLSMGAVTAPAGSMLASLGAMVVSLRGIVSNIDHAASRVAAGSECIGNASRAVADAAGVQSDATASMAAAMEQMTVSISHISDSARETATESAHSDHLAEDGAVRVASARQEISRIAVTVTEVSSAIRRLAERADQISSIAGVIKEIAGQTNLLALNAAIEAARAGEQGRGFAVVADEVRKLAERTAAATVEIEGTITTIQTDTVRVVKVMDSAIPQVGSGVEAAEGAAQALQAIREGAHVALRRIDEVADAMREHSQTSTSIAQRVEEIARMIEETSTAMRQTADTASELENVSATLRQTVGCFHC